MADLLIRGFKPGPPGQSGVPGVFVIGGGSALTLPAAGYPSGSVTVPSLSAGALSNGQQVFVKAQGVLCVLSSTAGTITLTRWLPADATTSISVGSSLISLNDNLDAIPITANVTIPVSGTVTLPFGIPSGSAFPSGTILRGVLAGVPGTAVNASGTWTFTPSVYPGSTVAANYLVAWFIISGDTSPANPLAIGAVELSESGGILNLPFKNKIANTLFAFSSRWQNAVADGSGRLAFGVKRGITYAARLILGTTVKVTTKSVRWTSYLADKNGKITAGIRNDVAYLSKILLNRKALLISKWSYWSTVLKDANNRVGVGVKNGVLRFTRAEASVSVSAPFLSGIPYKKNRRLKGRAFGGISNGQSLSVGSFTTPLEIYPYYPNNALKLVDTGAGDFATVSTLKLAPMAEPIRQYSFAINQFPLNCMGEGGYNVLGTELTRLLGPDLKIALDAVGVGGASMSQIRFGGSYNSFASSILQYTNMRELFRKKGLQFEILFNLLIHGQADALSATYLAELNQYYNDTQSQHRAITGQSTSIPLIIDQNSAGSNTSASPSLSSIAQWTAQKQFGKIIMATPGYQYYGFDTNHLSAGATKRKYIKFAQVIKQVCFDHKQWRCTDIMSASVSGSNIIVNLYIPFGSVEFDPNITQPANINWGTGLVANPWINAKGFECFDSGGAAISLTSATITGQSQITLAFTGGTPATLRYALAKPYNGTPLLANPDVNVRGAVRDQDPHEGFDKQEILCTCINGANTVYSTNLFGRRAPYDKVLGIGVSRNAIIASIPAGNQINLSEPWKGQTGLELLTFVHPQGNYLAQFSVSLPYTE